MRCPESLTFNHWSHSSGHELSITCQIYLSLKMLIKQCRKLGDSSSLLPNISITALQAFHAHVPHAQACVGEDNLRTAPCVYVCRICTVLFNAVKLTVTVNTLVNNTAILLLVRTLNLPRFLLFVTGDSVLFVRCTARSFLDAVHLCMCWPSNTFFGMWFTDVLSMIAISTFPELASLTARAKYSEKFLMLLIGLHNILITQNSARVQYQNSCNVTLQSA
jgi:hypothetical protein